MVDELHELRIYLVFLKELLLNSVVEPPVRDVMEMANENLVRFLDSSLGHGYESNECCD